MQNGTQDSSEKNTNDKKIHRGRYWRRKIKREEPTNRTMLEDCAWRPTVWKPEDGVPGDERTWLLVGFQRRTHLTRVRVRTHTSDRDTSAVVSGDLLADTDLRVYRRGIGMKGIMSRAGLIFFYLVFVTTELFQTEFDYQSHELIM